MVQSIRNIIIDTINKKAQNRKIVIWGRVDESNELDKQIIEEYNGEFAFYVTVNPVDEEKNLNKIKHISVINNKAEEYFVVIFPKETPESHIMFEKYGFKNTDLFYIHHKPIIVKDVEKYVDEYGNQACLKKGCQVVFEGYNCIVKMNGVVVTKSLTLYCNNNANIIIKEGTVFEADFKILAKDLVADHMVSPIVTIDKTCKFIDGIISCFSGKIEIAEGCTFGRSLKISALHGKQILIGRDCMFSHEIWLLSGDAHMIFDLNTQECINSFSNLTEEKKCIVIGEHVWIGLRAFVLNGTSIGNGSIVGASSLVKGSFTNNCIIAGNPAKLIRKDIAWSRHPVSDNIDLCGAEYRLFSE